jgi:hypothetical protein
MIAFLFLASTAASPAPVLYAAEARSIAYRDCIVAARTRRADATVVEIGRTACARARSRLVAGVRDRVSYGWAATAKTDGQARRLRSHLKAEAETQVVAYDRRVQEWLERRAG